MADREAYLEGTIGYRYDVPLDVDLVQISHRVTITRANGSTDHYEVHVGVDPDLTLQDAQDIALQDAIDTTPIATNPQGSDIAMISVDLEPVEVSW